jgi:hypothetical protein
MSEHLAGLRLQETEFDDNALVVKQGPVSIIIIIIIIIMSVHIFHFQ